jgi:hypothetical protein
MVERLMLRTRVKRINMRANGSTLFRDSGNTRPEQ